MSAGSIEPTKLPRCLTPLTEGMAEEIRTRFMRFCGMVRAWPVPHTGRGRGKREEMEMTSGTAKTLFGAAMLATLVTGSPACAEPVQPLPQHTAPVPLDAPSAQIGNGVINA